MRRSPSSPTRAILIVQTRTQLLAYANPDRAVRNWTRLPLAVSGAFSTDHAIMTSTNWDTMIVGRSIGDAVHPLDAPRQLITLIYQRGARLSSARDNPS